MKDGTLIQLLGILVQIAKNGRDSSDPDRAKLDELLKQLSAQDELTRVLDDLPAWLAYGGNVADLSAMIETVYRLSPLLADRVAAMFVAAAEMRKPANDQAPSPVSKTSTRSNSRWMTFTAYTRPCSRMA